MASLSGFETLCVGFLSSAIFLVLLYFDIYILFVKISPCIKWFWFTSCAQLNAQYMYLIFAQWNISACFVAFVFYPHSVLNSVEGWVGLVFELDIYKCSCFLFFSGIFIPTVHSRFSQHSVLNPIEDPAGRTPAFSEMRSCLMGGRVKSWTDADCHDIFFLQSSWVEIVLHVVTSYNCHMERSVSWS